MNGLDSLLQQDLVFSVLSTAEREEVMALAVQRSYGRGDNLAHYGDVWPYLFVVAEGAVQGLKESREGRSLIVIALEAGDLFWGSAFFEENAPLPVMLQAQQASQIWLWQRDWLLPILWGNGRFSWELSRLMIRRMMRASEIVEELAFQPVAGRLAGLLLDHYQNAFDEPVARNLTLDQMAAHIGTTREMVCRILYRFSDEDLIHITRTEFVLNDKFKLMRLSGRSGDSP
jgi:CRP/FNR family transcriptional regulator